MKQLYFSKRSSHVLCVKFRFTFLFILFLSVSNSFGQIIVPNSGNNITTTCSTVVYDNGGSGGNYANNSDGYSVINPTPGNYAQVTGSITTEAGWDFLTIYDGVGLGGTLLWGGSAHGTGISCETFVLPTITSISGSLTIQFESDFSNNCGGFNLSTTCSTTPGTPAYCIPSGNNTTNRYIDDFTATGTGILINNNTGYSGGGYGNFSSTHSVSQNQGGAINFSATLSGFAYRFFIWVDWNNDGDFDDAGELVINPSTRDFVHTGTFNVPITASLGDHRMRIRNFYNDPSSCGTNERGEAEDYTLTVTSSSPCSQPTAQPTALILNPSDATITGSFTAASPAPDSYLVVYNTTNTTPNPIDGTAYTIGDTIGAGNTVADTDGNTNFSVSGLSGGTTYYFFVFSYNNSACSPNYLSTSPLTNYTTTLVSYCIPSGNDTTNRYIDDFTAIGTNILTNNNTGYSTDGYGNFSSTYSVSQIQGGAINFSATLSGFAYRFFIWVDWNNDGDFDDAGELVINPSTRSFIHIGTFNVPITASLGDHRMRIRNFYNDPSSCGTNERGEAEDYTLIVTESFPCSQPLTQPTALTLDVSGTTITGNFTAASPAPDSYLVVYNTTNTTPNPIDGTTYIIGDTVGAGNTVADNDGNTNFSVSGLSGNTTYYFFVFAYNNSACSPNYLSTSPLTNNATTSVSYCTPSTTNSANTRYIDGVEFIGTLNDVSNFSNGWSTTTPGYQDWTALTKSTQQQGEGINVYVEGDARGHFKAWVDWDIDGTFDNSEEVYDSGGIGTTSTTFGYVVPSTQALGDYRLRIRFYNSYRPAEYSGYDFDACETFDTNGAYTEYGEAEDYLFTVLPRCDAQITSITNGEACGTDETVDLSVTGSAGVSSFRWYDSETGGTLLDTTTTGDWTTPNITATTVFWVEAYNGCWSYERERIIAFLNAPATLEFTPTIPIICGEDSPPIEIEASSNTQIDYLIDEDFEGAGLGSFTGNNITSNGAPYDGISQWQQRTSAFIPSENVWFPAISSGFGADKFVMSNADSAAIPTENELVSAVLDASSYLNLTLELDMYFSRYNLTVDENVNIEVSTNGGTSWSIIDNITDDVGYGTRFDHLTYDLSAYAGETNLRVRVYYYSDWGDGVAIDNVVLYGNSTVSPLATWSTGSTLNVFIDPAGTVPYTGIPISTIYVVPTVADLQSSIVWSFSATVTLANGCSASGSVSLENRTRYFTGATDDWNDSNNWKPAVVPTPENCVIIPDTYTSNINGTTDGDALNVTIQNGGSLNIEPNGSLTIVNFSDIKPGGNFEIENGASLIQVDNVTNTGTGDVKRNSANVRDTDYIYWSSPVNAFNLSSISPSSPYKYQWIPTVAANAPGGFGDWTSASGNMTLGKGYIVRAGTNSSDTSADTAVNSIFRGIFNNGNINMPISSGTYNGFDYTGPSSTTVTRNDDNWNLIGNPYPSAIDAQDFLAANTNIEGAVHIWTHGTQIGTSNLDPFYEDFGLNYSVNDYLTYNSSGASSGAGTFGGYIASGQGFFVMMNHGAADTDVNFDNSMRHKLYDNSEFYRTQQLRTTNNELERHRIWLSIISPSNETATSLVGYIEGATLAKDRMFDAYGLENNAMNLFSLINDERMLIQGRPLPFNVNDQVPVGAVFPDAGNYTIAIHSVDGLFEDENQNIYLEDLELNIIHNLRNQPYSFNTDSGAIENRFILRYTDDTLSTEEFNKIKDLSISAPKNEYIKITSNKNVIKDIVVYDLLGRVLIERKNSLKSEVIINDINNASGTYIVKVTLVNGLQKTQKVILK
ncbi:GEVED domain-containing protein [Psychroserpens luteus]|uniref:GEVED domain-containing protein n=1 Tax=Psychroserpens luteus TaxID=1434066 RepID=A0ABW5ZRD6_9FLAO|nr:GEVED domain-containing protein [Psychroserpens luteus]